MTPRSRVSCFSVSYFYLYYYYFFFLQKSKCPCLSAALSHFIDSAIGLRSRTLGDSYVFRISFDLTTKIEFSLSPRPARYFFLRSLLRVITSFLLCVKRRQRSCSNDSRKCPEVVGSTLRVYRKEYVHSGGNCVTIFIESFEIKSTSFDFSFPSHLGVHSQIFTAWI